MQHAHDLNRLGAGIVDDQIGVDGPEFQGMASEILAHMAGAGLVTETRQRAPNMLQNLRAITGPACCTRKILICSTSRSAGRVRTKRFISERNAA